MPHPDHILNITCDPICVVHLHADRAGLDLLIRRLQGLRDHLDKGECEHDHFMADSWGGYDLSEECGLREEGHAPVYHLKVMAWTDDWAARHGFTEQEAGSAGAEVSLPPSAREEN